MGNISGERTVEIVAPIERCFQIAADIANAPEWRGSLREVDVIERDGDRRAAGGDRVGRQGQERQALLRFSYEEPTAIRWVQEKGETKSLTGSWTFEDLGGGRTRATYALDADPGRILGLLLRGSRRGEVRDFLLGNAAAGLKERAERDA